MKKAIKKLCMDNPRDWDQQVDSVLYALRTKVHSALGISPYEFLFGLSPPSVRQDPLQIMGRKLGFERLMELTDRNIQVDNTNKERDTDEESAIEEEPGSEDSFSSVEKHPFSLTIYNYFAHD